MDKQSYQAGFAAAAQARGVDANVLVKLAGRGAPESARRQQWEANMGPDVDPNIEGPIPAIKRLGRQAGSALSRAKNYITGEQKPPQVTDQPRKLDTSAQSEKA